MVQQNIMVWQNLDDLKVGVIMDVTTPEQAKGRRKLAQPPRSHSLSGAVPHRHPLTGERVSRMAISDPRLQGSHVIQL